jgi:serine/threonine-protein kinase HipA
MAEDLAIWLYGERVAVVVKASGGRIRLSYTDDALSNYEFGSPLLSVGLPLTDVAYPNSKARAFLDGLLPEGEPRRIIAEHLNLKSSDTFELIRTLGLDCAGAVVVQPDHDPPPKRATTTSALPLKRDEIDVRVANLKSAPLGVSDRVRISLAGVQEKLLLTRMLNGSWGEPIDGTPSTHLLKPEIREFPNTVENEAFCMRLSRYLGVETAAVETSEFGGRKVVIVERFDRSVATNGEVERIHQEDFCQALGLHPTLKYQSDGGPSLRRIAALLKQYGRPDSLDRLLRLLFVNVLIGNGDAHGKNFSLMHHRDGTLELSPAYDLLSTLYYVDGDLSMYIDHVRKVKNVTGERLVNEAVSWGLREEAVRQSLQELVERTPRALELARRATNRVPGEIEEIVASQLKQLTL